jgi:hypothetical protein
MSLFGGVSSFLQGGKDKQAEEALNRALETMSRVKEPTLQELSLPELQMYVQAGILTPAQAQAYVQESNAYNEQVIPQTGTQAMVEALNQLSGIADAGPEGTAQHRSQVAKTVGDMNRAVAGQRGAIEQDMAAKGTPTRMIQAALSNQYMGQDAQQAYQNSLQSQAQAEQMALQALSGKANVGQALQGQQNTQANTVAQAQNAMQQFNAANQQQASQLNAQMRQQAGIQNQNAAQDTANRNTQTKNARTAYNTGQNQQVFDNAMRKAGGVSDIYGKQAANYTDQGQKSAAVASSMIGSAASMGAGGAGGAAGAAGAGGGGGAMVPYAQFPQGSQSMGSSMAYEPYQQNKYLTGNLGFAHGGMVDRHADCMHDGGICMDEGGMVPGQAPFPGDTEENDIIHAKLSPGEAVIPRTAVQENLPQVLSMISESENVPRETQVGGDAHDVATVLQALRELRMGV